jgi:D-serine deaminase-like pyridoxal phosphate-dependent protein
MHPTEFTIGFPKHTSDTPQLCLDLDAFESNLHAMAQIVKNAGKQWRPHSKCHKSPEVAQLQLNAGAIGVTCAKVSEAEIFAAHGITDILIAHIPVGESRVTRIVTLRESCDVLLTCDHYIQAEKLSQACAKRGVVCRILVDINIGLNRTGVCPGRDAVTLAQGICKLPGLQLVGIMGYEGHVMPMTDPDDKRRAVLESLGILKECRYSFEKQGLKCDIVSAGGTGSLSTAVECDWVTEFQAGGGIFGDPFYTKMPGVTGYRSALTVLSTVVSRPTFNRAVVDAGRKAITAEIHPPLVKDYPDAKVVMHSAEHITLELGPKSRELQIGDRVELIVGYADFTTLLHDEFLCFREDKLEAIWPITARGKLQ